MTRSLGVGASVVACLLGGGCANAFINGGKMATRDHAQGARAAYRISGCTNLTNNSTVAAPALTYHVTEMDGRPALFERDDKGKGVVIENHWSDAAGDHYFATVTSNGWEYVLPSGGGAGARLVYNGVKTQKNPDGSTRPLTQPSARCELVASAQ